MFGAISLPQWSIAFPPPPLPPPLSFFRKECSLQTHYMPWSIVVQEWVRGGGWGGGGPFWFLGTANDVLVMNFVCLELRKSTTRFPNLMQKIACHVKKILQLYFKSMADILGRNWLTRSLNLCRGIWCSTPWNTILQSTKKAATSH